MSYAWQAYRRHAFGHDELMPVSRRPHDWIQLPPPSLGSGGSTGGAGGWFGSSGGSGGSGGGGGGLGLTLVDSLDLLWMCGMEEEFNEARDWVADESSALAQAVHLYHGSGGGGSSSHSAHRRSHGGNTGSSASVNFFETTIRALGGLLSAYNLSKEPIFLRRAKELGLALSPAFDSPSGVPFSDVDLEHRTFTITTTATTTTN